MLTLKITNRQSPDGSIVLHPRAVRSDVEGMKVRGQAGRDPSLLLRMTAQQPAESQPAPVFTFGFCVLTCSSPPGMVGWK